MIFEKINASYGINREDFDTFNVGDSFIKDLIISLSTDNIKSIIENMPLNFSMSYDDKGRLTSKDVSYSFTLYNTIVNAISSNLFNFWHKEVPIKAVIFRQRFFKDKTIFDFNTIVRFYLKNELNLRINS